MIQRLHSNTPLSVARFVQRLLAAVSPAAGVAGQQRPPRIVVQLALITAVCVMGDAMLYVVLPVYPSFFGIAEFWQIGVLLSVNRLVRLPLGPLVGWMYHRLPMRSLLLTAIVIAGATTLSYALAKGFWPLLAARALWGAAWSLLRLGGYLSVLDAATDNNRGRLLGAYNGLWGLGSLVGLLAGGAVADRLGPAAVALALGALTFGCAPLAALALRSLKAAPACLPGKRASEPISAEVSAFSGTSVRVAPGPGLAAPVTCPATTASASAASKPDSAASASACVPSALSSGSGTSASVLASAELITAPAASAAMPAAAPATAVTAAPEAPATAARPRVRAAFPPRTWLVLGSGGLVAFVFFGVLAATLSRLLGTLPAGAALGAARSPARSRRCAPPVAVALASARRGGGRRARPPRRFRTGACALGRCLRLAAAACAGSRHVGAASGAAARQYRRRHADGCARRR
ncbi:MFS transporter [Gordoniibacillus kamchatkensis]|uniref:MFS transporter n=1 Tax=Gordoniibacillus kamchatkensis TaxID=1590651 RepID=UPI000695E987|nr:MFS transporter [Paenibacillus sp. VKM B-2647]